MFGADAVAFAAATLRVTIEDTTYADAPATIIAQAVTAGVSHANDGAPLSFELQTETPRPRFSRWTLRVRVAVDGDGRLGAGDYVNTVSVLLPEEDGVSVTVPVKRI